MPSPPPPPVDNRKHPRFPVRLSAEVNVHGKTFTAVTRDLSIGGVCLESIFQLPENSSLQVALFLVVDDVEDATQPPLEMRGKVAWTAPGEEGKPATMGVRFEALSAAQMSGLNKFLKMVPTAGAAA